MSKYEIIQYCKVTHIYLLRTYSNHSKAHMQLPYFMRLKQDTNP